MSQDKIDEAFEAWWKKQNSTFGKIVAGEAFRAGFARALKEMRENDKRIHDLLEECGVLLSAVLLVQQDRILSFGKQRRGSKEAAASAKVNDLVTRLANEVATLSERLDRMQRGEA